MTEYTPVRPGKPSGGTTMGFRSFGDEFESMEYTEQDSDEANG